MTPIPAKLRPTRLNASTVTVPNETQEQKLARAKGYPYPRPTGSFLFRNGLAYELRTRWQGINHLEHMSVHDSDNGCSRTVGELCGGQVRSAGDFTPVLAIGSNASPQQLARKYPADLFPEGITIPVVECILEDFDVVYAPSVSTYGSCPATLEHSPGTAVRIWVTYLQPKALQRMHETEGTYNLLRLSKVRLHLGASLEDFAAGVPGGEVLGTVFQYNHQHGSLKLPVANNPAGTPIALAEIDALHRQYPAMTQPQMLHSIRLAFCPKTIPSDTHQPICLQQARHDMMDTEHHHSSSGAGITGPSPFGDLDEWILGNIESKLTRKALVSRLVPWAQPLRFEHVEVLATLGLTNDKIPV